MKRRIILGTAAAVAMWMLGSPAANAQLADPITHYLCYKPKVDKLFPAPPDINVANVCDQFQCDAPANGGKAIKAGKPKLFCNTAIKNLNAGPPFTFRPNDHLKCYSYKRKLLAPIHVQVSNQFGIEQLYLQKASMLCLPTDKTIIP